LVINAGTFISVTDAEETGGTFFPVTDAGTYFSVTDAETEGTVFLVINKGISFSLVSDAAETEGTFISVTDAEETGGTFFSVTGAGTFISVTAAEIGGTFFSVTDAGAFLKSVVTAFLLLGLVVLCTFPFAGSRSLAGFTFPSATSLKYLFFLLKGHRYERES